MNELIKSLYRLMVSSFDLAFALITTIVLAVAVLAIWVLVVVGIYLGLQS